MTPGARNLLVLVATLVVVGLLMLLPTSTNRTGHHRGPGGARAGVVLPSGRPATSR